MSVIFAGLDEAGYGPKLGPLTLGWTAFEVSGERAGARLDARQPVDLWELLADAVRRERKGDASKVWVADSKAIKPKKDGLKQLELGVLAFRAAGEGLSTLPNLLDALGQPTRGYRRLPWYTDLAQVKVPAYCWPGEVAARAARIAAAGAKAGVRYVGAGVRVLDVIRYNQRIHATQNKGQVLGEACAQLLEGLRARTEGPLSITVDKHGGRSTYLRLLGAAFPLCKLDILTEGPDASAYGVATKRGPVVVAFRKGAEEHSLPAALASMHCKYLRELFMDRVNAWFGERVPGLKPTAGYAVDANRFLADVGALLPELGVPLDTLVRAR